MYLSRTDVPQLVDDRCVRSCATPFAVEAIKYWTISSSWLSRLPYSTQSLVYICYHLAGFPTESFDEASRLEAVPRAAKGFR